MYINCNICMGICVDLYMVITLVPCDDNQPVLNRVNTYLYYNTQRFAIFPRQYVDILYKNI